MNEEAAFIAALVAEPSDRTAALVFADWLDERGDPRGPMMRIDEVRAWMAPKYGNPLPDLCAALESGKRITEASKALALIGEAAVPGLVSLLTDKTTIVRMRAVKTLRLMGPRGKAALPALMALVKDAEHAVRNEAFLAATDIVKGGSVETAPLREALHDADSDVRRWAASLLGTMRAAGAVKNELAKGLDSPDAGERLAAINAMSNLYTTAGTSALCKALSDSSVEVRRAAAKQLSQLADSRMTKAVDPLRKALADPDAEVKSSALGALGKIGPAAAVALPDLLRLLTDVLAKEGAQPVTERTRLLWAVAQIGVGRPEVLEVVLAAVRATDEYVRSAAVEAFRKWTALPPSAAPALLEFVRGCNRESWSIQYSDGLSALARITPQPPEVLEEFRTQLAGKGARTVAQVLEGLGPLAAPLLPELIAAFQSGHSAHLEIARALGKIGGDGIAALVAALGSEPATGYNPLREAAMTGLNVAGPAALSALPALLARLREPLNPYARAHVLRTIEAMGPGAASAVPDLMVMFADEQVEDPYDSVRSALEAFGPAVVPFVPRLTELLRQPARAQRHPAIIRLLTSLIPHGADMLAAFRDVLRQATAGDPYAGEGVRRVEVARAAIRGLAALGPAAAPALPELALAYRTFTGPSTVGDAREDVLDAYGEIGGEAVPDIRAALADTSWKIRGAAVNALGATGDTSEETVAALRALETDASSKVRARAAAVLKKMEPRKGKRARTTPAEP
jgi:uncharacterized protein (TIGR02996 family)